MTKRKRVCKYTKAELYWLGNKKAMKVIKKYRKNEVNK